MSNAPGVALAVDIAWLSTYPGVGMAKAASSRESAQDRAPTDEEIETLMELAGRPDVEEPMTFISGLVRDGMSVEKVLLGLVAPAARRLAERWEVEQRPYAEVARTLDGIQRIVERLRTAPVT